MDVELLRLLDGILHEVVGDLVTGLTGHVTQIIVAIQRENQAALCHERSVGLLTDNGVIHLSVSLLFSGLNYAIGKLLDNWMDGYIRNSSELIRILYGIHPESIRNQKFIRIHPEYIRNPFEFIRNPSRINPEFIQNPCRIKNSFRIHSESIRNEEFMQNLKSFRNK